MTPCTITRSTEVAASPATSWASISSGDGLARWLGEDVCVESDGAALAVGSVATVVDDGGALRRLVVTEVDEGRHIGFTWWDDDAPLIASQVTITIEADGAGSTITATETVDGAALGALGGRLSALAPASVHDLVAADRNWGHRLNRLTRCLEPTLTTAGV